MQDFMSQFGMIVTFIGGVSIIGGVLYTLYRVVKRIDTAIGVDSKGRTIAARMDRVEYQLWENGGESLKDQVNKIEKHALQTATEVGIIKEIMIQAVSVNEKQTETIKPKRRKTKVA